MDRTVRLTNHVEVDIRLANGTSWSGAWDTPATFGHCFSRGRGWAQRDMQTARIAGRSQIHACTVSVRRTSRVWEAKWT